MLQQNPVTLLRNLGFKSLRNGVCPVKVEWKNSEEYLSSIKLDYRCYNDIIL